MLEAILFDLDGTLADTAPDLGAALNRVRAEEGLKPLPLEQLRPYTSHGVRGLLNAGFGITTKAANYSRLSHRFLEIYAANLCVETKLFHGMDALLDEIENAGLKWGIVTNKRARFTTPLIKALGLLGRPASVVSGDTTPEGKPSPLPVLHACGEAGCHPERTLFVGDDLRDIQAGRAAGTRTAAVSYGYLGDAEPIETWGADWLADTPEMLSDLIFQSI